MKNLLFIFAFYFFSFFYLFALNPGEIIPPLEAKNQDGKNISLASFKGKFLLLYFYPKDDTSGCTKEAANFRDKHHEFKKMNTVIFGVSRQDEKSHKDFRHKYQIPFDLLVDTDGNFSKALGVGLIPVIGLNKRQSLLIGKKGEILRFYEDVDPETHTQQVMDDLHKFMLQEKKK